MQQAHVQQSCMYVHVHVYHALSARRVSALQSSTFYQMLIISGWIIKPWKLMPMEWIQVLVCMEAIRLGGGALVKEIPKQTIVIARK